LQGWVDASHKELAEAQEERSRIDDRISMCEKTTNYSRTDTKNPLGREYSKFSAFDPQRAGSIALIASNNAMSEVLSEIDRMWESGQSTRGCHMVMMF